jgi:purine-nucleoside phosphorylase
LSQDDDIEAVLERLRERGLSGGIDTGLVLGTGLGALADEVENPLAVPYADLPGFPGTGVSSHAGRLVIGEIGLRRVAVLQGRAHAYETGDARGMRTPLATLARLGASTVIVTSAVGSLKASLRPGSIALLADHINLSGLNPMVGEEGDARFVSLVDAYDPRLRYKMKRMAAIAGVSVSEAVYAWFQGPSFETPAEVRMAGQLGADVVGMSMVPEVILARRFGMRVVGLSIVTNLGAGIEGAAPTHAQTKSVAETAGIALKRLIATYCRSLDDA